MTAPLPPLQAYQWAATGMRAYDRNHFGVAQYVNADEAERAMKLAVREALERAADICKQIEIEEGTRRGFTMAGVAWEFNKAIRAMIEEYR